MESRKRNRKGRNRGAKKMEEERGAEQMGQGLKIMKTEVQKFRFEIG